MIFRNPQWDLGNHWQLGRYNGRVRIRPISSTPQLTSTLFAPSENTTNFDMSNPLNTTDPSATNSSDDNQLNLFTPELSELVGDPEMVEHLCTEFSDDLISSILIWYYQYVSLCITQAVDVLDRHYEERNNLFRYAISNEGFNRAIQPVTRMYRRKWWELSHPYSWPQSHIQTPSDEQSIDPPTSLDPNDKLPLSDTQSIPILPEPSDASSSSYVMALDEELEPPTTHAELIQHVSKTLQQMIDEGVGSSRQNPINIDQFDEGPGSSWYNPIDIDHPHTNDTNPYVFCALPHRSDDSLARAMGRNQWWPK